MMSMTSSAMGGMSTAASHTSMHHMPMGTSSPSSSSSMMMNMDSMAMTFFTSTNTPLYTMSWVPTTAGQYAGTCIFLIAFAAIFRALLAVRVHVYPLLAAVDLRRDGGLRYEGFRDAKAAQHPWRARDAIFIGLIDVVLAAVGYLLMIAVMTMNVGYFLSVLGGVFIGSVVFGRFLATSAAH